MRSLARIWTLYLGGFVGVIALLWALEKNGLVNQDGINYSFMFLTIGVYAVIGILSRTNKLDEYYVAGRSIPGIFNGMATGSDWMSAASFIGMAGLIYALGYEGMAYIMGWTGGYVLLAVFLAPYIRKFGQYTIPDFVASRYGEGFPRVAAVLAAILVSLTYLTAQVTGVGVIMSRFLHIDYKVGVFVGLLGILVCSFLGGMRAVTWTQVAQYIILIIAYMVPVVALSYRFTGVPVPQVMYGEALQNINTLEAAQGIEKAFIAPFNDWSPVMFIALTICLMAGTAGLPHILVRFYTVPSVRESRYSVGWALLFIFLLYFTAPAYATFTRWEILANTVGQAIDSLPAWVQNWQATGLLSITDANADGILQFAELQLHNDAVVLSMPEIAGLPAVVAGLIAAGGLAAALSTADGLLMVVATAISHDLYFKLINPKASDQVRLWISKILLIVVALVAAVLAQFQFQFIANIVAWAFSLAAASFFPVLVLGIWWKRATKTAAVSGMLTGLAVTFAYIIYSRSTGHFLFGIRDTAAGIFGMPLNFLITWLVSYYTPAPAQEVQDAVEDLRYPKRLRQEPAAATGDD